MKKRNWSVWIPVCLAFGGLGNIIVMCILIGFSFHTLVGKEAVYVALALEFGSLLACSRNERRLEAEHPHYIAGEKLRRFRRICGMIWLSGAGLLLFSLILALCGLRMTGLWVRIPCVAGLISAPIGWIGLLLSYHHRQEALLNSENP